MFLDLQGYYRRQPDPPPENPPRPELSVAQQKLLVWLICFNLLLLLVAPIGGATVVDALLALLTG